MARWPGRLNSRTGVLLCGCSLVLAALAVYYNSFSTPFIFDAEHAILKNPTIRHLSSLGEVLSPPTGGSTVSGRPFLNFTLAVNYAFDGSRKVWGYHALNLLIHVLAGLTLFGLVRRTLLRPVFKERLGEAATFLAFSVALLWTVHPLQTESVTYIVQRAVSLAGLFYLLTLYCVVRGAESPSAKKWYICAVTACLLGMMSKEVMASAPLMVLLYDRTFIAGTFREAWQRRRRLYLSLAGTWLLLAWLIISTNNRGGTAGFDVSVSPFDYACTQCWAVIHYLQLSVWPRPLIFDYGTGLIKACGAIVWRGAGLAALVAATAYALRRKPALGFIGCWFFFILAPTSSVVPIVTQTIAEHRMYLPLAGVIVLFVLGLHALIGRRGWPPMLLAAVFLGLLTVRRNADYQSRLSIWSDTVAKRPENPRAHDSLGNALDDSGRTEEAIREYQKAVELEPWDPSEHYNLGRAFEKLGRTNEAMAQYQEALKLNPNYAEAHNNLGVVLAGLGRVQEAIDHYQTAMRLKPDDSNAHYNLGTVFFKAGQLPEAVEQFSEALRLNPDYPKAHDNLGSALAQMGRISEAIFHYEKALLLQPDYAEAHNNLGVAFVQAGRVAEAISHFQTAIGLKSNYADAHLNLGDAYLQGGRLRDALAEYERTLRLKPDNPVAHTHLGIGLFQMGKLAEAARHFQRAQTLKPDYAQAYYWEGNTLAQAGRIDEAVQQLEKAVQLKPGFAEAHNNLGMALMQTGQIEEAVAHFSEAVRLNPDYVKANDNLVDAQAALATTDGRH